MILRNIRHPHKPAHFRTGDTSGIETTQYQKTILSNGIKVLSEFIPHVRSFSLGMWVTVGSRNEDESNNGITHFLEHITFKGTTKRTANAIAKSLEQVGGYLNAYTSKEHTCFYARALDEHVSLAFDVLADLLTNATLDSREIAKEKLVVLEEIKQTEDDPADSVHEFFESELYKPHPLQYTILGTPKSVQSLTKKQLFEYYHTYYTPQNIIISAAGNIQHSQLVELTEKYFASIPRGKKAVAKQEPLPPLPQGKTFEIPKPIQQAHICMGTLAYNVTHPRRYVLQVLNTLLGEGMSSRLFQSIRERHGIAYSVYSFHAPTSETGSMGAYIATDRKKIERCIELVWKEFEKIKNGKISRAEIQRTKAQIKGSLLLSLESIPNRMIRLASNELYYGGILNLDDILANIEAVTIEEVLDVAQELLQPSRFLTVILRPENGKKE